MNSRHRSELPRSISSSRSVQLRHRLSWQSVCVLLGVALVLIIRRPAPAFAYDAAQYWNGSLALIHGGSVTSMGGLDIRGVLTVFVYAPAVVASALLGSTPRTDSWSVLVENAVWIGCVGALVLPKMLIRDVPRTRALQTGQVASTVLTAVLLSGFAPYPMMDVPALALAFLGLRLVMSQRILALAAGGAALAIAVNLRPAYLLAAAAIMVMVVLSVRSRSLAAIAGAALVASSQLAFGRTYAHFWSVLPPSTSVVNAIQLTYAGYGVRYDTVYLAPEPRQWYCDPRMASIVQAGRATPMTNGDLLSLFVRHVPQSAELAIFKVTAALQWSWATPYAGNGDESGRFLGLIASLVAIGGFVALIRNVKRSTPRSSSAVALILLEIGCAVTIVGSAPEARFGAPLISVGIAGIAAALSSQSGWARRAEVATALTLTALLWVIGAAALAAPVPRGDLTTAVCLTANT